MKSALSRTQAMWRSLTRPILQVGCNDSFNYVSCEHQNFARIGKRFFAGKIDSNSWAAERLLAIGEKLEQGPTLPLTEATDELLMNPSQNIKDLANEIISLNVLEINQLLKAVQVSSLINISVFSVLL